MANTLKFGAGEWATKVGSTLAYNDENGNFKPLPFNFTRATSATRVNKDGLIEVVTNNKPRIDFKDDVNGALLLEPERRNLITYSEDFNSWSKSGTVNIETGVLSPAGNNSASTLSGGGDLIINATTIVASTHIFSIWVKGNIGDSFRFQKSGSFSYAQNTITIDSFDWKRYEISRDFNVATGQIIIDNFDEGLSFWGAQLEQGSYATSYIPTQGSQVTKVQDTCSQTPPSGIIGQTEGVAYVEIDWKGNNEESIFSVLHDGTVNNRMDFGYSAVFNSFYFNIRTGGTSQGLMQYASPAIGKHKVAISYKNNDFALWVNGVKEAVDNSGSVPITTQYNVGNYIGGGREYSIINSKLYNTALTDQELQQLTSL